MGVRPAQQGAARGVLGTIAAVLSSVLYLAWTALVVVAPVAAAWVASSIAAHAGGSMRAAAASGLLVFPVLPVAWEMFASWRRSRSEASAKRFLTLVDRLVLRTLAVSAVLLGALVAREPQRVFVALNGRGDWMLDGRHDARAEAARRAIFWVAARTAVIRRLADHDALDRDNARRPPPPPTRDLSPVVPPHPSHDPAPVVPPVVDAHRTPVPPVGGDAPALVDAHAWPTAGAIRDAVRALPASVETSPSAVGRYLAAQERDPWSRARAVHDYVADRVEYDVEAYRSGVHPPQDADTTFRTHKSVCAGYAALFEAVGRAAGLEVVTIVGRARGIVASGMGEGHAWNAVKLDGRWRLVDTTWDSGAVDARGFHKRFDTVFFATPPEVFIARHYPDDPRWQLLPVVRSPGEYLRAPLLDPAFFVFGLGLVHPDRAESDARGVVDLTVDDPHGVSILVTVRAEGGTREDCEVTGTSRVTAHCTLAGPDLHEITLFASTQPYGEHWSVGSLQVHNR